MCGTTLTASSDFIIVPDLEKEKLTIAEQIKLCSSCRMIKRKAIRNLEFNKHILSKDLQNMGLLKINTEVIIINCNCGGITDIKSTERHK